jgi:hypothetical protein
VPDLARSDWTLGTDAQLRHDNNVGNAGDYANIVGDTIVDAPGYRSFNYSPLARITACQSAVISAASTTTGSRD